MMYFFRKISTQTLILVVALFSSTQVLAQTVLSFDDVAQGALSTQYQAKGVTFNLPMVRDYSTTPGFAHSGHQAVEICFAAEFCKGTLNATFTTGQSRVKLLVGFTSALAQASPVIIKALDVNGAQIAQQTVVLGPSTGPIPVQTALEVLSASSKIRQIVVGFAGTDAFNNGLVFDDLSFDTEGPPPICTATADPGLNVILPTSNTTVQINEFQLQGTVTTQTPLDRATLTVSGSANSKVTDLLNVIIQPASAPFGATRIDESLSPGTNTVTVTVHNCHGQSQASAIVNYDPIANQTKIKLLRMEITQATQDSINSVPLVAGKPTIVRLYFATTGGPALIQGVRGDLSGFQDGGNTPFLAQSVGTTDVDASTDVDAKRLDLSKSLNFLLSSDFYQRGLTHFRVEHLNVQGPGGATLLCDGCVDWSARFAQTRPLNLVVVPFFYEHSNLTADAGATLMSGLGFLNNVFPLSGSFPNDTAGINMTLLPTRSTSLVLPRDNDRMLFDLDNILDDLFSQGGNTLPADTHILGVAPSGSGGVAEAPGAAAFGDARAAEATTKPASDGESYGSIWAQEIAHNFGRKHVSTSHGEMPPTDPAFPYPHGGIGEPGVAIGTEAWNGAPFVLDPGTPASNSKHAHDFMSYGAPNDAQDHTHSWVSPFSYNGLMNAFSGAARGPLPPTTSAVDKLAVGGSIDKSGKVTLFPFHMLRTTMTHSPGDAGEFRIIFQDANGQSLTTYRFDPHVDSASGSLIFNELIPWKIGTKQIVLQRGATVLGKRAVSKNAPNVQIVRPRGGETLNLKTTIQWRASDADRDALTYTVLYNGGEDQRWITLASGVKGQSVTLDSSLIAGSSNARIKVRATDGVNTTEAVSDGSVIVPNHPPIVSIAGPISRRITSAQGADLSGMAYDPKEGVLPASKLEWTSNRDGLLGNGGHVKTTKPLSKGAHSITLTATNGQGLTASRSVNLVVR